MDPFIGLKYLALVIRAGVKRVGWKWVIAGWVASSIAAVILNYTV